MFLRKPGSMVGTVESAWWLIKRIACRMQSNHAGGLPPGVLPLVRKAHQSATLSDPQVLGKLPGLRFAGGQFIRKQWWLSGTADTQYLHFLIAYQYDHSVCVALAGSKKHLPQRHPAVIRFRGERICLW